MGRESKANPKSARPAKPLTEVEWAIMGAVWQHQPCTAGTVQEALDAAHGWAYSTVKTTMDRMVAKGLLSTHAIRNLQMFERSSRAPRPSGPNSAACSAGRSTGR